VLLYYITDRHQFPGTELEKRDRLLGKIAEAADAGVDLIQLRERDLSARELYDLATEALPRIREMRNATREARLLINSRLDVALAASANGVHFRGDDISAADGRAVLATSIRTARQAATGTGTRETSSNINFLFGVSCHSLADVLAAEAHRADFAVYAPVFEKRGNNVPAVGLDGLRQACQSVVTRDQKAEAGFPSGMPILALGGVTLQNARDCISAGASGIAAIRLFQDNDIGEIVAKLCG